MNQFIGDVMLLNELLLSEFDQEMKKTRNLLERVPPNRAEWKPHEKSMALGRLAGHIAELPRLAVWILGSDTLDMTPMVSGGYKPPVLDSSEELLKLFDKNVSDAREALAKTSEDDFKRVWSMQLREKILFSMPRIDTIRSMFMNHLIHHRAQLGVYLRLNNVPLPEMYGPSADEGISFANAKG
jgi:uncharacterized damage-inducible protein DinB